MRRDLLVAMAFTAVALVVTGPALVRGDTFGGTDILAFASPYREAIGSPPTTGNPLQTDQMEQIALVAEFWAALRQGDLQLWEPDAALGIPLFTAVHNRTLVPWFAAFLVTPAAMGTTVAMTIGLICGQYGTYALARRLGLRTGGAVLAAVVYVLSGPSIALLLRIHEVLLLPGLLWALHGAITAPARRGSYFTMTALITAAVWFSGFPAAGLFVLYFSAAFCCWLLAEHSRHARGRARLRMAALLGAPTAAAVVAGTGLAAIQLLPGYGFLGQTGSLEREYGPGHRAGIGQLATVASGRVFGRFQDGSWWLEDTGYSNPVEASMTLGAVVLLLALVVVLGVRSTRSRARALRAVTRFFMPAALVVLVAVYLGGPVLSVIQQLPFMSSNSFGRARFIAALGVALAAGTALDAVRAPTTAGVNQPWPAGLRLQCAALLALVALGLHETLNLAAAGQHLRQYAGSLALPFAAAAMAALLLRTQRRWAPAALILLACGELAWGSWGFVQASPASLFYPPSPALAPLREDTGATGDYRFMALTLNALPPHASTVLDLKDLRVSYPSHERYRDLLTAADPEVFTHRRLRSVFTAALDVRSPIIDAMAARYLVVPLRDPPLELGEPVTQPLPPGQPLPATFRVPMPEAGIRHLEVSIQRPEGCEDGWFELHVGDQVVRRLAREAREEIAFPLPDLEAGGQEVSATLRATDCSATLGRGAVTVFPPGPSHDLRIRDVSDWVVYERRDALPRASLATGVQRIDDAGARLEFLKTRASGGHVVVEGAPEHRAVRGGDAALVVDQPDRVVVQANSRGPGLLVLRDMYAEGWTADVDDEPVEIIPVDHAMRGVWVPDGASAVEFRYEPPLLRVGVLIAACSALVVVALTVLGDRLPVGRHGAQSRT